MHFKDGLQPPVTRLGDVDCRFWNDVEEQVWLGLVMQSSCLKQLNKHVMFVRYCLHFPPSLVLA